MRKPRNMAGWRQSILADFTPQLAEVSRLTVVSDPDGLLGEAGIAQAIREAGFEIIQYHDHVAFRYAFETRFRQAWDSGQKTNLVVVLRTESASVSDLPYDLLHQARRDSRVLELSIAKLFPFLAPSVVAELDKLHYDRLFNALKAQSPSRLGENGTMDFILRHVFGVDADTVTTAVDLLHLLLEKHYRSERWPESVDERLVHLLRMQGKWNDWPLDGIIGDRPAFFGFLDERWPLFLQRICKKDEVGTHVAEEPAAYGLTFSGPPHIPFGHGRVHVYVDNLFIDGHLTPSNVVSRDSVPEPWMQAGVVGPAGEEPENRLELLLGKLEIPNADATPHDWSQLALRWGDISALRWRLATSDHPEQIARFEALQREVNEMFVAWLEVHYPSLASLGYVPRPTMVHHVAHSMAHHWHLKAQEAGPQGRRMALVVMDGLAMSQWTVIRETLNDAGLAVDDSAVYAWVPTFTSVSRQAIFFGEPPFLFGTTIGTTQKDEKHWQRFWEQNGVQSARVGYVCQKKQEEDEQFLARVREKAEHPRCRVLGIVAGTIDQMMHGTVTGMDGLQNSVSHWAAVRKWPVQLVEMLLEEGFEVVLTSDHGNAECVGIGKPNVGVVADERGERAHVFPDELTRQKTAGDYPTTRPWPPHGLPAGYFPLLTEPGDAFITQGKRTVAHGGHSIEEVLVPYATIRKRT